MDWFLNDFLQINAVTFTDVIIAIVVPLILGFVVSFTYMKTGEYNVNFARTLVILPILICVVIMLVNGKMGTALAVLGVFSLVRFRSVQGSSRDITFIFFAMAVGFVSSMEYVWFGVVFTVLISAAILILHKFNFAVAKSVPKELRITIPENLDYNGIFDDLFKKYTKSAKLKRVKTVSMGSMYELFYDVTIIEEAKEKEFIDEIRCRNGNLNIVLGQVEKHFAEL